LSHTGLRSLRKNEAVNRRIAVYNYDAKGILFAIPLGLPRQCEQRGRTETERFPSVLADVRDLGVSDHSDFQKADFLIH